MNTTETPTPQLRAYHGDPAVKLKYTARMAEHRRMEHLTQGTGWEIDGDAVKGCAVGCTLERYDHDAYPAELGLPVWLARLQDHLFERLQKTEAEQFAVDFLDAIPVGADVEPVRHRLAILRHGLALERLGGNAAPYAVDCRNAIQMVIAWHQSMLAGEGSTSARSAESAAWSAAWSARSAESAAWSAAWSAESAHVRWERDTLLRLLRESGGAL